MKKGVFVLALAVAAAVGGPVALAGAPMGPPMAIAGEGRWVLDAEYGYEEINMEAKGPVLDTIVGDPTSTVCYGGQFAIDDLAVNMGFLSVGYGVCENWDVFIRIGLADASGDLNPQCALAEVWGDPDPNNPLSPPTIPYDGEFGFAYGVGTRGTICHWGPWRIGFLGQVTWFDPDSYDINVGLVTGEDLTGRVEMDYWQAQFALAAVLQVDNWYVWAGPFAQFISGDLSMDLTQSVTDVTGTTDLVDYQILGDIREGENLGVHAGVRVDVSQELAAYAEAQLTGDSWLFGIGAFLRL